MKEIMVINDLDGLMSLDDLGRDWFPSAAKKKQYAEEDAKKEADKVKAKQVEAEVATKNAPLLEPLSPPGGVLGTKLTPITLILVGVGALVFIALMIKMSKR